MVGGSVPADLAPAPLPFDGDELVVADLIAAAFAARAAGDGAAADLLAARARALGGADPALGSAAAAPCDVDEELARGERALVARDAASAVLAFRRASVCDVSRAAPLWGLSRAFDAAGARGQGRRHAAMYVTASKRRPAPRDVEGKTLAAAVQRAEAPDDAPVVVPAGDADRPTTKRSRAP